MIKLITSINPKFVSNFLHFSFHILLCFLFFSCCLIFLNLSLFTDYSLSGNIQHRYRYIQSNTNKFIFHPPTKKNYFYIMIEEKNSKKRLKEMESRQKRKEREIQRTLRVQGLYGTLSFSLFYGRTATQLDTVLASPA